MAARALAIVAMLIAIPCQGDEPEEYLRQVKPVLQARCVACHGALKQEGGLRLDTAHLAQRGGSTGAGLVAGEPAGSLILKRVSAGEGERMPPEGEPLTSTQIDALQKWIANGARGPKDELPEQDPRDHWAFRAPVRPAVPRDVPPRWSGNPIDAFVAAQHQQRGVVPQPPADKSVWLRRVTLDLTGLPPTREELLAFLADESPEAWDRVVNRLLESPQYGERWGRHWMDVWRYSDWWGLGAEVRNSQKHIWHWRDWIVESLNRDQGYDQMLREMLAADELYPNDLDKLRASGFLARQYFKFNRTSWLDETIEHTAKSMLGLTFNCAKCHDHKYDPISQQDYYRFRAVFEPYQIRTDVLPGELDLEKNGLPRAFDCNLEAPTYVHVRGDDRNPDQSAVMPPAIPAVLSIGPFQPVSVALPADAYEPGIRPFVGESLREAARQRLTDARTQQKTVHERLMQAQAAEQAAADRADVPVDALSVAPWSLIQDDFHSPRPERWEVRSGQWAYADSKLIQSQVGAVRNVLRLTQPIPADFEARLVYRPTGGERWKSVGISFDVTATHDVLAYASSVSGGSKVQVAFQREGQYSYPPEGAQARNVALNEVHEFVLRVRGTLVNVILDGQPALAYRLPIARQSGALELVAFDAAVEFHRCEIRTLPESQRLIEAAGSPAPAAGSPSLDQARQEAELAERSVIAMQAELESLEARIAADQAQHIHRAPREQVQEKITAAVRAERKATMAKLEVELARAVVELAKATTEQRVGIEKKAVESRAALEKARAALDTPGDQYTPLRGSLKTLESNLESEQSRNKPFPRTSTGRRTALANWITDPRNPLTARVAVNHLWGRHFGRPLVPTVFDFGRKGTRPLNPELLDWLAIEFQEHAWSMKHMHRLMVTSQTYRLASTSAGADPSTRADPDNQTWWRALPRRMESECVRDSILFLAGELDLTRGGAPVPVNSDSRRRSLYFVHSHNEHNTFLSMFDDASVLECYRRVESIVPQQALALANSGLSLQGSEKIAARILSADPQSTDDAFVRNAFETVLNVRPGPDELRVSLRALEQWREAARRKGRPDPGSFARSALVLALLNHNDFVTIR